MFTYWKSLSWAILIGVLLFLPSSNLPKHGLLDIPHFDKMVHFGLFLGLEFILLYDFRFKHTKRINILPTLLATVYAFLTEGLQHALNIGRDGNWFDLLANIAGCIFGVILFRVFMRIKDRYVLRNS